MWFVNRDFVDKAQKNWGFRMKKTSIN